MLQWKGKQHTFSVIVRPALISSSRYEYACSGLVKISYRNINHSFIGNLSAVEAGKNRGVKERKRNVLKGWGLKRDVGEGGSESWKDKECRVCVCAYCVWLCVCTLDRDMDREISLPQQVCPLALFHSIWGYHINSGKHASLSLSLSPVLFLTPSSFTPSRWALRGLTVPVPYVSAETKVPLRVFLTVFFSTVCSWSLH